MSDGPTLVNIGTAERPIMVPEESLHPDSETGAEWWEMVASGSVVLEDEKLDTLLGRLRDDNGKSS